ncbi:MAG: zinc ribbon domain-containing protein [Blastocatellia bacterium]
MFCPKCSAQAVEGQRFCRSCGVNLGLIVDAMEGRAVSFDFDTLKKDLRQLGMSLRTTFEEVRDETKRTKRLQKDKVEGDSWTQMFGETVGSAARTAAEASTAVASDVAASFGGTQGKKREKTKPLKIKSVRGGDTRQSSLQKGLLSILGGGALAGAWWYIMEQAWQGGLLQSLEQVILAETHWRITGLAVLFRAMWVLSLIPVGKGVAHLLNGAFFPAQPIDAPADLVRQVYEQIQCEQIAVPLRMNVAEPPPPQYAAPAVAAQMSAMAQSTDELLAPQTLFTRTGSQPGYGHSITEDATEPLPVRGPGVVGGKD